MRGDSINLNHLSISPGSHSLQCIGSKSPPQKQEPAPSLVVSGSFMNLLTACFMQGTVLDAKGAVVTKAGMIPALMGPILRYGLLQV